MNITTKTMKETILTFSQFYFGQFPSRKELIVIKKLGQRLCESYSDLHEHLLRDVHRLSGVQVPYQRVGKFWKYLGYQNENPASDIRGGGLLSLDNLIYLLSTHPTMAQKMLHRQSRDNLTPDNQMESYPWAAVGINITRYIAMEFELIETSGRPKTSNFSPKTTWSYLTQTDGFNRLYCLAFFLLNTIWHEMKATYMQFPQVLSAMKTEFSSFLLWSSSLSELELTIYQRVNYSFDPSYGIDYTILPHSSDVPTTPSIEYDLLEFGEQEIQQTPALSPSPAPLENQQIIPDFLCSDSQVENPSIWSYDCDHFDMNSGGLRKRRNNHQLVSAV